MIYDKSIYNRHLFRFATALLLFERKLAHRYFFAVFIIRFRMVIIIEILNKFQRPYAVCGHLKHFKQKFWSAYSRRHLFFYNHVSSYYDVIASMWRHSEINYFTID